MVRVARSFVARVFAVSLLLLVVSPVTAPFTTCTLSDHLNPHSTPTSHPGSQLAVPHAKAARLVVTAPTLQPVSLEVFAAPQPMAPAFALTYADKNPTRQQILRL